VSFGDSYEVEYKEHTIALLAQLMGGVGSIPRASVRLGAGLLYGRVGGIG
jgi:hypothetical protein